MSTATGHAIPLSFWAYRPADQAGYLERASPQEGRDGLRGEKIARGSATNTQPISLVSSSRAGRTVRSFFDDFYNRVYFIPANINFGPISTEATQELLVWNAHLNSVTLSAVTLSDAEGLSIDGETLPFVFSALAFSTYSLTVTTAGPPELEAEITFDFSGESYTIGATGSRAKISPFFPNWRSAYTIEYAYKTEMFTSRKGREQRRSLRSTPRKSLSFQATPAFAQLRRVSDLMAAWQNNVLVLPEVTRQAILSVELAASATIATLAEAAPDWVVPDSTFILAFGAQYETRRVASVAGSTVTFTSSTNTVWPAGTKLHPALAGRMATSVRAKLETNAVAVVSVDFEVSPATEPVVAIPAASTMFNGREVFTVRPNWASSPEVTFLGNREDVDFDRGIVTTFTPIDFLPKTHRYTYTGRNYADMLLLEEFFRRMKGRAGEFYMPTWENDIQPKGVTPGGSNSLRIAGREFAGFYAGSTVYKAVCVLMSDNTMKFNVVEDIFAVDDVDGQDSVVQCADTWDEDLTTSNVKMISWLPVWRHATDTLSIEWLTSTVGQVQMTLQTLEDLA